MTNENHEQMLIDTAAFLKKYTAGIFDRKTPAEKGTYYRFPEIVDLLCMPVPEISISQCSESAGVIGFGLVPLFSGFLDGSLDPSRIRNNAPKPIAEFLDDYQKIWIPSGPSDDKMIRELNPDLILDLAVGNGFSAEHYLRPIRSDLGKDIQFLGTDKSWMKIRRAKKLSIANASFFVGTLRENGDVSLKTKDSERFSGMVNKAKRRLLIGSGACGYLSDYMGNFCARNHIEGFSILRCCYHEMPGRTFSSEHGQSIPLNKTMERILSEADTYEERDIRNLNLLISNIYRQAVSLDFALQMQSRGYSTGLGRMKDHFNVHGSRN